MAIHNVLAIVTNQGVAKLFYAHPVIQKTSLVLNNKSVIKAETGTVVKIALKTMPSSKRILLGCYPINKEIKSIQDFIDEVGEERMKMAAQAEAKGGWSVPELFDGTQDASYLVKGVRSPLPRFSEGSEEIEDESSDGFITFGDLFIPEIIVRTLKAIKTVADSTKAANVLLVGPSGNGKTSLAKAFADTYGMSFTKVNCSTVRDPEEWFGYREAKEGSTVFVETDFTQKVKEGNAVILLDEINRLEPYLHNSLMPLLDETRHTQVHGNDIPVGENVIFFCTMNLGAGFVGTFLLDTAVKNRMDATITMQKLSFDREVQLIVDRVGVTKLVATSIVTVLEKLREAAMKNQIEVDISHRSGLKIARLVKTSLLNIKEAVTVVTFNSAESADQAKLLIDSLTGMRF
jgi:MoxR-like ATPase